MIIVKITSGLGNQLFQYAAACRLALKLNTSLKLDIDSFDRNDLRTYELNQFRIKEEFVKNTDLLKVYPLEGFNRLIIRKIFGKKISYKLNNIIERKHKEAYFNYQSNKGRKAPLVYRNKLVQRFYHFDQEVLAAGDNLYLLGYFQSEKFFKDYTSEIRKKLEFKFPVKGKNKELLDEMQNVNSVSIHIRRGDYVKDKSVNKLFGTCTLAYYQKAINVVTNKVDNCKFYVFSDDINWAKENLTTIFPITFVSHNTNAPVEDLRLMSNCRHNILANSSFSWWGGWLNKNSDKIVIAPKNWVLMKNYNTKDLLPGNWMKI